MLKGNRQRTQRACTSLLLLLLLLFQTQAAQALHSGSINETTLPPSAPVPADFFGLNINDIIFNGKGVVQNAPVAGVGYTGYRLMFEHTFWSDIQANGPTDWEWTSMDNLVNWAYNSGLKITYVGGWAPGWETGGQNTRFGGSIQPVANLQDLANFMSALVTRYKGQIAYYTWRTEPQVPENFSGTTAQLVAEQQTFYNTVKAIDPNAVVLSPDFLTTTTGNTNYLNDYLAAGGASYCDYLGVHPYVEEPTQTPDSAVSFYQSWRSALSSSGFNNIPMYATETGWPGAYYAGTANQGGYVARNYILAWANGVVENMWYMWNFNKNNPSLILNGNGSNDTTTWPTLTNGGVAYETVYSWLVGNTMKWCGALKGTITGCGMINANGQKYLILWTSDDTAQTYTIPTRLNPASSGTDCYGNAVTVTNGQVSVGPNPVRIQVTPGKAK